MARKAQPSSSLPSPTPSMDPQKALARLQRLLQRIQDLKGNTQGSGSPLLTTRKQDVQGVLSHFYGRPSLQLEQLASIRFSQSMVYPEMPRAKFVEAREKGLASAEGFLRSRIMEIEEDLSENPSQISIQQNAESKDVHKIFVVHGHDHGSKEAVA